MIAVSIDLVFLPAYERYIPAPHLRKEDNVMCDDEAINRFNSPVPYFHKQLLDLTVTATRTTEAGASLLVGHYLCHAILRARPEIIREMLNVILKLTLDLSYLLFS